MIRRNRQGSVLLHLVGFTFPFFSWYASSNWWRFPYRVVPLPQVSVPSDSLTSLWPISFGLYACLDFGACPKFLFLSLAWVVSFYFFSPFFWCFLFIKFHRVSPQWAFLDYIYFYFLFFKIFEFVEYFLFVIVKSNDKKESSIITCPLNLYWSLARRLG